MVFFKFPPPYLNPLWIQTVYNVLRLENGWIQSPPPPPCLNLDLHILTDIHYGDCTKRTWHWASSCRALKNKQINKQTIASKAKLSFFFLQSQLMDQSFLHTYLNWKENDLLRTETHKAVAMVVRYRVDGIFMVESSDYFPLQFSVCKFP